MFVYLVPATHTRLWLCSTVYEQQPACSSTTFP